MFFEYSMAYAAFGLEHLVKGTALLMSAMYYVEHKDAASMLDLFGRGGQAKEPPTVEEWEAEATHQVAAIAATFTGLLDEFDSIDDVIAELRNNKKIMAGAVLGVLRTQIFSVIKYTWRHRNGKTAKTPLKSKRKWAFYALAIGAVLLMSSDSGDGKNETEDVLGELLHKMFSLLKQAASDFPGRSPPEAELYGKIVGNLLGGFVLDRFLFKDNHPFRKVFDAPVIGATLKGNLRHGVVKGFLALIFKRYLSLYNDLVKHGVLSTARREEEFASLVNDVRDAELANKGLDHLATFESDSEKSMSLADLAKALLGFHKVLQDDGVELLQKHYGGTIERLKEDLAATSRLSDDLGITGFAEEHVKALFVVMNTHVRLAMSELSQSVSELFRPFIADGHFSWMMLLKELGFDVGDVSQIQNEVRKLYADRLGGFSAKSD